MNELKNLQNLVNELNESNLINAKKEVLAKHPECIEMLKWTYSPFTQFNTTSKSLKKRKDLVERKYIDIIDLLDDLNERVITGHKAISCVNGFIEDNKEYEDLIHCIIDKNLKTRADTSLINKVFPKAVPVFEVALAKKYEDFKDRIDFEKDDWYVSRKLDGVRIIMIVDENGDVEAYSRNGKKINTLGKVSDEIKRLFPDLKSVVFDGEICLIDDDGNDSFAGLMKLIMRKDYTIEHPRFKVFDYLTLECFNATKCDILLSERLAKLNGMFGDSTILNDVKQSIVRSAKEVDDLSEEAVNNSWEGIMLRKDVGYEGKRTKNLLKVKKFSDAEYIINDVEMGPMRVIVDGLDVEEVMLSSIKIEHKRNVVSVGSGFSLEERRKYYKNPELIIGKEATVQYFEETLNQHGEHSLRFPVIKHIYLNGRQV